jgi:hypothetical protein
MAPSAYGQSGSPMRPEFEVASVKPHSSSEGSPPAKSTGTRCVNQETRRRDKFFETTLDGDDSICTGDLLHMSAPAISQLTQGQTEEPLPVTKYDREAVARLAYAYWEMRLMDNVPGTADDDWYRSEQELGVGGPS